MCKYEGHEECKNVECPGIVSECNVYFKLNKRAYRESNPEYCEKERIWTLQYSTANREKTRASTKKWQENNHEKYLESQRKCSARDSAYISATLYNHKLKYDVQVTHAEALELYQSTKTCRYCGKEMKRGDRQGQMQGPSLDRIDNSDVITKDNIQFICKQCNLTKSARTHDEFMAFMRRALELNP
jgi:hypothetical protein